MFCKFGIRQNLLGKFQPILVLFLLVAFLKREKKTNYETKFDLDFNVNLKIELAALHFVYIIN